MVAIRQCRPRLGNRHAGYNCGVDQPANNLETVRPSLATRIIVRGVAAIMLLVASVAALLWPTKTTVNIVGGILLVLQIGSLAIVLNPLARWRLASAVFLLV